MSRGPLLAAMTLAIVVVAFVVGMPVLAGRGFDAEGTLAARGEAVAATSDAADPLLAPTLKALAAGTFLYLGTLHGLANGTLVARCCDLREFSAVVVGFALTALVAIWT